MELEANFGAVVLQCGTALFDKTLSPGDLAKRAHCVEKEVRNVRRLVQLDIFMREFAQQSQPLTRVIL